MKNKKIENRKDDPSSIERRKGVLNLECRLTDAELKETAKHLADAIRAKQQVEGELETFKQQKKAEVAAHDAVIARCSALINSEKEFRMTGVQIEYNYAKGVKTFYRADTGEIVRMEAIQPEERQMEIEAPPTGSPEPGTIEDPGI